MESFWGFYVVKVWKRVDLFLLNRPCSDRMKPNNRVSENRAEKNEEFVVENPKIFIFSCLCVCVCRKFIYDLHSRIWHHAALLLLATRQLFTRLIIIIGYRGVSCKNEKKKGTENKKVKHLDLPLTYMILWLWWWWFDFSLKNRVFLWFLIYF